MPDTGHTNLCRLWYASPTLPDSPPLIAEVGHTIVIGPVRSNRIIARVLTADGSLVPHSDATNRETLSTETEVYQYPGHEYVFRLVYNDSGSTIQRGAAMVRKAATASGAVRVAPTSSASDTVVGVALWDIPTGSYTYVLVSGQGKVIRGASNTADTAFKPDAAAAGRVTDISAGDAACGIFLASSGAAGDLQDAVVLCRY